jgi:starvation-inducible DNA-binding protein
MGNFRRENSHQLHLLFDKHYDEQVELVDSIAERIRLLGAVQSLRGKKASGR